VDTTPLCNAVDSRLAATLDNLRRVIWPPMISWTKDDGRGAAAILLECFGWHE